MIVFAIPSKFSVAKASIVGPAPDKQISRFLQAVILVSKSW